MTVGEIIRQERKKKGITQDELAKRLGITRSAVGQFEKTDSHLRYETILKIAEAMDVPVYQFSLNEGERIKAIRELKGLSRKDLADKVGISTKSITDIEKSECRPSNSLILKLAAAMGIPYSALIPGAFSDQDVTIHKEEIDDAIDGLKAIIRRLYNCTDTERTEDQSSSGDIYFTENDCSYIITEQAFRELVPLVNGLVGAYVEQKKINAM